MYVNGYNSSIYNGPKLQAAPMSINRCMDKQKVANSKNRILEFPVAERVKDPALSLPRCRFDPRPRNLHMLQVLCMNVWTYRVYMHIHTWTYVKLTYVHTHNLYI